MKNRLRIGMIIGLAFLTGLSTDVWSQEPSAAAQATELPSAETILDRYVEVTGGKEAYERRTSEVTRGKIEISSAGISGTLVSYARPGLFYEATEIAGLGKMEAGSKDGIAWENSIVQGPRILKDKEREMVLRKAVFNAPIHWREIYSTVETVGIESIDGKDAYRVLQTPKEGNPETAYYSIESGLEIKSEETLPSQMGDIPIETTFSEYREFEGVLYPVRVIQKAVGQNITGTIESVEINVDIPDEQFDLPEAVQALVK